MLYVLKPDQLEKIETVLMESMINIGIINVIVIDVAGNIIANCDNGECDHNLSSLAALAAGNFGAVSAMAKIVGEEEFSLLFHKGQKESIHFSKISDDFLLVSIFGPDVSLGMLRLKVAKVIEKIDALLKE